MKFTDDGYRRSFTVGKIYDAYKAEDGGYAIYDDGVDWYRYSEEFVRENFEIIE